MKMQARTITRAATRDPARGTRERGAARVAAHAVGMLLLAGFALAAQNAQAAANALIDVSHVSLPGDRQQVALTMSGPASIPKAFTIDNPARIALDLADTANELDERRVPHRRGAFAEHHRGRGGRAHARGHQPRLAALLRHLRARQQAPGDARSVRPRRRGARRGGERRAAARRGQAGRWPANGRRRRRRRAAQLDRRARLPPRSHGRGAHHLRSFLGRHRHRHAPGRRGASSSTSPTSSSPRGCRSASTSWTSAPRCSSSTRSRNKRGTKVIIQPATQEFEQLAYQSGRSLHRRAQADEQGGDRGEPTGQVRLRRREALAELPGHRGALGAAAARRLHRSQHRRLRRGGGQAHAAPEERALGPGARHHPAEQGARQASGGQRHHDRAGRGDRQSRAHRARGHEAEDRARPAQDRVLPGQPTPRPRSSRACCSRRPAACSPSAAASPSTPAPTRC